MKCRRLFCLTFLHSKKWRTHKLLSVLALAAISVMLMIIMDTLVFLAEEDTYREISVVYTWVNGSDPEYQKQRQQHPPATDLQAQVGENRWRDNNELRFSLRSLNMNAPWVKDVWLVINDDTQPPCWLNISHPQISIVRVSSILPNPKSFPIFNSNAIELNIHNIKGLTDPFIYLNDDFYFMLPVKPSHFVTHKGYPKFFWTSEYSWRRTDMITSHKQYALVFQRTNELLDKSFGAADRPIAAHAPYVYSKAAWDQIYSLYKPIIDDMQNHRYREQDDINSHHLHHYFTIHSAEELRMGHRSFEGRQSVGHKLGYYSWPLWWSWLNIQFIKAGRDFFWPSMYKIWKPLILCINDDYDQAADPEGLRKSVQNFLLETFPDPSPWENVGTPIVFT